MLRNIHILGVTVTNERKETILEYFFSSLEKAKNKIFITTPNPEMLVYASKHLDYKDKLNSSTIALPDGIGLFFASGFKGEKFRERIPGVDFIEELCKACKDKPLSMGFLGGRGVVAEQAAKRLKEKYPWINIVFTGTEWPEKNVPKITHADILFVAYGVPKQEEWIYAHLDSLPFASAMGVGGAFDFLSGNVRRAPFIMRFVGLEWLFRLTTQPWRWKRQLALIEFIFLVLKYKVSKIS